MTRPQNDQPPRSGDEETMTAPRGPRCRVPSPRSPDDPEPLRFVTDLTGLLIAANTVEDVLDRVTVAAEHAIPGADLVSITVRGQDGSLCTPAETAHEATELDQQQYRHEEGPCLDAADPSGPAYVLSPDLAREDAWPAFTAAAVAHGYSSILSTALLTTREPAWYTGALNIYSRRVNGLGTDARDLAFLLATHASLALATARAQQSLDECGRKALQLREALETRTVIGQATGILMARRDLTAAEAFEVLNRTSQKHNVKLARLARLLADRPEIAARL